MPYPRRLGAAIDCTDPNNYDDPDCIGIDAIPGFTPQQNTTLPTSGPSIFETILTDVSQFLHPGTPSTRPLYTPGTTATSQALNSPVVLVGLAAAAYLLLSRRR